MKASETKFQQIIEGTKQYIVPLFQRPYSWDKGEWEDLFNDLKGLIESENSRTHFIGSIVTMPTTSVPEGIPKYLLIDGQQRLTTIIILLILLRDLAQKNGDEEFADEIKNTLLVNPYKKDLDYYKLQPTHPDRAAFYQLIKPETDGVVSTVGQGQIQKAYDFFYRKLLRLNNVDREKLKETITTNLSVVSIVLGADDDPYLVFESLNAKGRSLTKADLIRNYFFMKVYVNEQERVYAQYWLPMQDALGENLTECIRHYLMREGDIVNQSDVYFVLKARISQGDVLTHLKDLVKFAQYYQNLLKPEKELNLKLREALLRINRIEVTTAYPLLLNCYDDYASGRLSSEEFVQVLKVIENFMIRRFVCNVGTTGLNKVYPTLYKQIQNTNPQDFVGGLKKLLQTKGYPKDNDFKKSLKEARLYGAGDRRIKTQLILESLEASYNHKEQVPFNNLTIEHIMPQTLTESWQAHLGSDWEITYDTLLHNIGNLTLTAYNGNLSNDDFEIKKKKLEESHLELNKYFVDKLGWKKQEIEDRSEYLANVALNIWPYFGEEKSSQEDKKDVTGTTPTALWILNQHFKAKSWRDVFEQTLVTIADLEPQKFDEIVKQYPKYVSWDKSKFREIRQLKNGAFIEVNLAAQHIRSLCFQMIQVIELTSEDWQVEFA